MNASDPDRPFAEPWQAQALAAAMSLQEEGVITASEWSEALGAAIRRAQARGDEDTGETYYHHVIDAMEAILNAKQLMKPEEIANRKNEWADAYRRTPHGQPVNLRDNEPN